MPPLVSGSSGAGGAGGTGGFFESVARTQLDILEQQNVILDKNLALLQRAREELSRATISGSSGAGGAGGTGGFEAGGVIPFGLSARATR